MLAAGMLGLFFSITVHAHTTRKAPVPSTSGILSKSDHAHYEAAFKAATKKNWQTTQRHARRAKDRLPAKILRWMEMSTPGNNVSFREISAFITANPDWPRQSSLQRRTEEAITGRTPNSLVRKWFDTHPPRTTDGMIIHAELLIRDGKRTEGRKILRKVWTIGRFTRKSERFFLRQHRKLFSKADHWKRLDHLLWKGRHREARRLLRRVTPDQRALANARISLRRSRGGVDRAIARVPQSLRRDPGLLYERARWRRRKGRTDGAFEIFANAPNNLGRPDIWARERTRIARRLLTEGRVTDAYKVASNHRLDPSSPLQFSESEWLAGWIILRFLDEPDRALKHFARLHSAVRYPVSLSRAAYWAGRAAARKGDKQEAQAWYKRAAIHSTTYHGHLAASALGNPVALPKPIPRPSASAVEIFRKHELVRVILVLDQLGQYKRLRTFMLRLAKVLKTPQYRLLVARLAQSIGRPDLGVWVARQAQRDGIVLAEQSYPLISMPAGRPERALLLAVARQESNFDAQAASYAGAFGIMQLMPATARATAKSLRIRYSRSALKRDPSYNIRLGRAYLSKMLSRYNESYILAISAYNAGPNAVKKWLRKFGDPRDKAMDPIDWIEMIPYSETRTYVQRVLGNLQVFRQRLRPGQVARTLDSDLRR
jgi:soluble lytic murein transglycosylase